MTSFNFHAAGITAALLRLAHPTLESFASVSADLNADSKAREAGADL